MVENQNKIFYNKITKNEDNNKYGQKKLKKSKNIGGKKSC